MEIISTECKGLEYKRPVSLTEACNEVKTRRKEKFRNTSSTCENYMVSLILRQIISQTTFQQLEPKGNSCTRARSVTR